MSVHDLSEHTKKLLDGMAAVSALTAISLSQVAVAVSIVAGLLSAAWIVQRFYDRYKYGPPKGD
jgi:hypothetical protein